MATMELRKVARQAEFMKRQQDSLAERLMSAGFIAATCCGQAGWVKRRIEPTNIWWLVVLWAAKIVI